ncbi:MAG TPA: protein kinase [Candidatus Eisenbacteria bacterium]|nr:protein kinase [Candidatus Eisenbacteria bacterium]
MLNPGTLIGPYRIEREIGRGGMGVIFLAQDTRLGRPAAIKALPEDVAGDPERLARFEREAKALASLTHPNVAGIYGLEEKDGRRYLALEYVEGESLAERLQRGPLSSAETIEIGLQIAAGIEAAHEAGIVHRDLKPGNVVITSADQAKVLDFGLAKGKVAEGPNATSPTSPTTTPANSPTLLHSPTLQTPATMPGVILGTAAYLSPEQARGKVVDRRTDIWSFGCILYECLTGKQVFEGETVSDTIAKILEREVPWEALPAGTPAALRALVARCLEKDPRRRLRDIGDARLALEELKSGRSSAALAAAGVLSDSAVAGSSPDPVAARAAAAAAARQRNLFVAIAFVLGAALAIGAWSALRLGGSAAPGGEIAHLSLPIPDDLRAEALLVTPSSSTLVLRARPRNVAPGEEPISRLYVRRLESDQFQPLPGTERVLLYRPYPNERWIFFVQTVSERSSDMRMMKIPLDGSAPASDLGRWDRSWGSPRVLESGEVLAPVAPGGEYIRIPAAGGAPSAPRKVNLGGGDSQVTFGDVLPGDRGVLLSSSTYVGNVYSIGIGVLDLKTGKSKMLLSDAGSPSYSPTGHLVFSRNSTLFAVPFDLGKLEVRGTPVAILEGLRISAAWSHGSFGLATNGTLVYAPGGFAGKDRRLVMIDAEGRETDWSSDRLPFEAGVWVTPDGSKAGSVVANASGLYAVWLAERGGGAARLFIGREGADISFPCWSPDGRTVAYSQIAKAESDGIYTVGADGSGSPRRILKAAKDEAMLATSWTPDGGRLLAMRGVGSRVGILSVAVPAAGAAAPAPDTLFAGESGIHAFGRLSPDGRLLAYVWDGSGQLEVYVRAWNGAAPVGEAVPVGKAGPGWPMWSGNGKTLYFFNDTGRLVAAEIAAQPRLSVSSRRALWDADATKTTTDFMSALPDGRILAIRKGDAEDDPTRFDVVLGFPELLKQRLRQAGGK